MTPLSAGLPGATLAGAVPPAALPVAAVLTAGLLHAVWNTVAKAIPDRDAGLTQISITKALLCLALLPLLPVPAAGSWPYLVASGIAHAGYMVLLSRSYRLGDFSQVYPIARGVAPLVVAVVAVAALGERLGPGQIAGLLAICGGLTALSVERPRADAPFPYPAVAAALATGAVIACYTVIDAVGVRLAQGAIAYTAWMTVLEGALVLVAMPRAKRRTLADLLTPFHRLSLVGGAVATVSYGTVLWAQTRTGTAEVAALRETGVIWAAVIGTLLFKEALGARRIAAAVVVSTGVVLLSVPPT
ncbi:MULTISPECIES: EamA family transporter [unclassified Streptomyces]|uniref:EamA family transporter n=1 Tax=unclassified Streptomyces TaxID=2593676 RepID=UPI0037B95643